MEFWMYSLAAILVIILLYYFFMPAQSSMTAAQLQSFNSLGGIHGQTPARLFRGA